MCVYVLIQHMYSETSDHRRSYCVSEIDKIFMIKVKNKKIICIIYYFFYYIIFIIILVSS